MIKIVSSALANASAFIFRFLAVLLLSAVPAKAATDLLIAQYSVSPEFTANSGVAEFTIRAVNSGPDTVNDAILTINVSDRFIVQQSDLESGCTVSGPVGGQTIECSLATFPQSDRFIKYKATARAVGSANTTATISSALVSDTNAGNNSLSIAPTVRNGADLTVTKDDGLPDNTMTAGGIITYTLAVNNNGPDAAGAMTLTDTLPPASDFQYQSASGTSWSCAHTSPTVTCNYTGPEVTGPLPQVTVTGRVIRQSSGTLTNSANVALSGSSVLDPNTGNNVTSVVTNINEGSDMRADKSMPALIVEDTQVTVTLTVYNDGPLSVSGTSISDTFAGNFILGAMPSGCSANGQTVTCVTGTLAAGQSRAFAIPVTADTVTGGTQINSATLTLPNGLADPNMANNTSNASYSIVPPTADLRPTKTKGPNPVKAGENMTSTITVYNDGPAVLNYAPGTPLRVTDTVSTDETFVSANSEWSCGQSGTVITCETTGSGTLAVGQTIVLSLVTKASDTANAALTNTACTGATGGSAATPEDTNGANDCTGASVRATTTTTDLAVEKSVSLDGSSWGENITISEAENSFYISLVARNVGTEAAGTVIVNDTLPNSINATGFVTNVEQISATSGTSAYTPSSGRISWTLNNLGPGASETLVVRVDRPFNHGTFTNTATITSTDTVDSVQGNNSDTAEYTVIPIADMAVTGKSINPNPAQVGVVSTYTINVRNNGANPAESVRLTDTIDTNRFELVGNPSSTKTGSICTKNDSSGLIDCDLGTFTRGQTFQVSQQVRPKFDSNTVYPINHTNSASVATATHDSNSSNDSNSVSHEIRAPGFNLSVTKHEPEPSSDYDPRRFGDDLFYDIRVSNDGPSRATNIVITDTPKPPSGYTMTYQGYEINPVAASSDFTLYSPPQPACAESGGQIKCYLHSSDPQQNYLDEKHQVIFRVRFTPSGPAPNGSLTFTNEVEVVAREQDNTFEVKADTQLADNKAVQTTTVLPSTDLEVVSKTRVSASPASINEPIEYAIVIRNNGPSPTTQVRVTDQLPSGFSLTTNPAAPSATATGTASVTGINCSGTQSILCVLDGSFPGDGSQVTIRLYARAQHLYNGPLGSNVTNTATIAPGKDNSNVDLSRDSDPTNNSKTATVQIAESSIAGNVYADANLNNVFDAGEGRAGVTVTLTGTDIYGNAITVNPATTDANGAFIFSKLPPGNYTLVETQPANTFDYRETAGTAGGTVNNSSFGSGADTNTISAINLPAQTAATGYLFQEVPAASLSGNVYRDLNNNGTMDGGETGISNSLFASTPHIRLTGTDFAGNAVNLTTNVNASGAYQFTTLAPSDPSGYTVTQLVQPNNHSDGRDSNGTGSVVPNSAGRTAPEDIVVGVVAPSAALTNRNFGELPTSNLSGMVFLDSNENAVRDGGENSGLSGATLRLTGTNDLGQSIDCQITTDATGAYSFPIAGSPTPECQVLRPGTYTVTETPPPGLTHTGAYIGSAGGTSGGVSGANTAAPGAGNTVISNIVINAGAAAANYNFGASGQGVSGSVYVDRNGNGVRDAEEPGIPGVTINLSGTAGTGQDVCTLITCAVVTDAAGNYLFASVPGSSGAGYTLTEQAQSSPPLSNYIDSTEAVGTVGGTPRGTAGDDTFDGIVLNAGDLGLNYNFGERAGSMTGTVYIDANDDGIRQTGEVPLAGITVTLSGTTASGADICTFRSLLNPAQSCTATTAADGSYRFDDLPAGNYTVTESQPSEYADGREGAGTPAGTVDNSSFGSTAATNRISGIALSAGSTGTGYDFGERATTLSGRVYKDRERDGNDAGGEPGIGGVTITLRQGGTVIATTTTGPDGSYSFPNLPAGNYTVEETQPAGYGSSTPDSQAVTVSAGANQSVDFGETVSTLAGSVFVDVNDDATFQAGERGLSGVTVRLVGTDATGAAVDRTATTDANGHYLFDDILSGTYSVIETQPANFSDGKDAAGTAGGSVSDDTISAIALGTGLDATGYLFGERGQGQWGTVYVDTNQNGVQDPGEPGIPDVTIELQRPDGTVVDTITTGPDGTYNFANIEAGEYVIVETQPAGYGDARENPTNRVPFTVGVGATVKPINFGERTGSIEGYVYNDTNGNGRRDNDEPAIAGVTLTLTGTDVRGNAVTQTLISGPDGSYRFTGLPGGTYTITETQPTAYSDGLDTPGTAGGAASGDVISNISLNAAQDATGYLFGEKGEGAGLSGRVWLDKDHDRALDPEEPVRSGWIVELLLNNTLVATTTTGQDGSYNFTGLAPGTGYELRFRNPENNVVFGGVRTNETGAPITDGVMSPSNPGGAYASTGLLTGLTLQPGANISQQSLPLDPSGVVYDSVRRTVVPGAVVRITGPAGFDPALHLVGGSANVAQTTGENGMYQFLLMPNAPAGVYTLSVTPPGGTYNPVQPSSIIPPCDGPLNVGRTPDPLLVSSYNSAPPTSAVRACTTGGDTTAYFLSFTLTPGVSANVVNNNIPIDPILEGAIEVTKTTPMTNVSRGGLVPYTITARNTLAGAITGITITDRVPAGFRYRKGSATIDGQAVEPQEAGRMLNWPNQSFKAAEEKTIQLILVVGSGVGEGEHVNQAFAVNAAVGAVVSNVADATVRLVPDPDFDCTDILGKVFDDRNMNGTQDDGEPGLPGVRLATARGLLITTDAQGRYHITCPMIPNEDRGSNFILKLDTRTLPTGYRMTTVNPETVRLTRGKFAKLNFGAALTRVVRLDVNGDAFEGERISTAFTERLNGLVATLAEKPSVLRVAYGARGENADLIRRRLSALRTAIEERWKERKDRYRLVIEEETTVSAAALNGDVK